MLIPNHPWRRLWNYFNDGLFWHKSWKNIEIDNVRLRRCLWISGQDDLSSKEKDSNWRENRKWFLLSVSTVVVYKPFFFAGTQATLCHPLFTSLPITGMIKRIPVKTRLFAMRIDSDALCVVAIDTKGKVYVPALEFERRGSDGMPELHTFEFLQRYAKINNEKITFI